jgi:hypothetical protein
MASAGTITVTVRVNVTGFQRGIRRADESVERWGARRSGSWNRFQMVGAR